MKRKLRLAVEFTANTQPIPWDYMHKQCGLFYRNLGQTEHHDNKVSLYSYSMLRGESISTKDGLYMPNAHMFISAYEDEVLQRVRRGFLENPEANFGMRVKATSLLDTPKMGNRNFFLAGSGILLRGAAEGESKYRHMYTSADDPEITTEILTRNLRYKMEAAGLSGNVSVSFSQSRQKHRTKSFRFGDIHNKVSMHPILIEGAPELSEFAWAVGVGHSTGAGFGSLI